MASFTASERGLARKLFANSESYQNGSSIWSESNSFYENSFRNGNGKHFAKEGYEEEVFDDYSEKVGESSFRIDTRALGAIAGIAAFGVLCYKLSQYRMEELYIDWIFYLLECFYLVIKYILQTIFNWFIAQFDYIWNYITDENVQNNLKPFIYGTAVGLFTWMMVYYDSHVPGLNPPSPFSPNSRNRFRAQKVSSVYHGYVMAVASGVAVTGLMLGSKDKSTEYLLDET